MNFSHRFAQGALILALLALSGCSGNQTGFSILFGGDVMLARSGTAFFTPGEHATDPWGDSFTVLTGTPASLFMANLESPFGSLGPNLEKPALQMNLCAPPESVNVLANGGIGLVTEANNHSGDCGVRDQTRIQLADAGIRYVPSGIEPFNIEVLNKDVTFFAVNAYSESVDTERLFRNIERASRENDLVVVSLHWGNEYQAGPDASQELFAQSLVDAGADILWGHHPHVLQRMEWKISINDGHYALVMYSLGNLFSDQWMFSDALQTAVIKVTVTKGEITGVSVIPLILDQESMNLRIPETGSELEKILRRLDLDGLKREGVQLEWKVKPLY